MFLVRPGTAGPLVMLQDAAAELHERNREAVRKRMEIRAKHGAGPDEATDFGKVKEQAEAAVKAAELFDAMSVLAAVEKIGALTSSPLTLPGEYRPHESLDGVAVRFRVLSEWRRREIVAQLDAANLETSRHPSGSIEWIRADENAVGIIGAALVEMVAEFRCDVMQPDGSTGTQSFSPLDADAIDMIRTSGLLTSLWVCAMAFQDLPPKKAWRFGLPPQSTLKSATATDADQARSGLLAAGVTSLPRTQSERGTSPGPSTPPTDVPAVTSWTTRTSFPLSESPAPSVTGSGLMVPRT